MSAPIERAHAWRRKHVNNNNKMAAYISEEIENESETLALSMSASPISKLKRVGIPVVTAAAKKRRILQRFKPEYGLVLGSDRRSELSPLVGQKLIDSDRWRRLFADLRLVLSKLLNARYLRASMSMIMLSEYC